MQVRHVSSTVHGGVHQQRCVCARLRVHTLHINHIISDCRAKTRLRKVSVSIYFCPTTGQKLVLLLLLVWGSQSQQQSQAEHVYRDRKLVSPVYLGSSHTENSPSFWARSNMWKQAENKPWFHVLRTETSPTKLNVLPTNGRENIDSRSFQSPQVQSDNITPLGSFNRFILRYYSQCEAKIKPNST